MPPRKKIAQNPLRIHSQTIEMVALADLKHYEKNARVHPEDQLKALEAIIRDSGFTAPLIIDPENGIIAGHGRALVAKRLKMAQVPCVRVTGLSAAQIKALRLSDNQAALRGTWDAGLLLGELTGLAAEGFKMDLTAFSAFQLGELKVPGFLPEEQIAEAEETPDPPKVPKVRAGEIWLMGDHRLAIGDSTDKDTVGRLFDIPDCGMARPNLMVTDPPYGVNYDPAWRDEMGIDWVGKVQRKSTHPGVKPLKSRSLGKVQNDHKADWTTTWALFPGDIAYVWHGGLHAGEVEANLLAAGFQTRGQIIWVKQHFVFSRGDYHWQHEPCWYAVRKGQKGCWAGDRKQTTVWEIANASAFKGAKDDAMTGHGTQKPIECMRRPILNNSKPGDFVYEPFAGSGTTLIAAEMEGRICLAIELDPVYAEVIITRWQNFTGKIATREDGKTLADLQRKPKKAA